MAVDYGARLREALAANNQGLVDWYTGKLKETGGTIPTVTEAEKPGLIQDVQNRVKSNDLALAQNNLDIAKRGGFGDKSTQLATEWQTKVDNLSPAKTIQQSIQPVQTAPAYTPATDNSGLINTQYGNLLSALKAQIQQSINNKNLQIGGLRNQYQPLRNQSEVRKASDLRTALEQSTNMGDRGGVGRQNALLTQTAGEGRINDINLQQETQKNSLVNDIGNLGLEQAIQSGQLSAQQIGDLIANNQYLDTANYNRSQDSFSNGLSLAQLLGNYNGTPTLAGQQFNYGQLRDAIGDQRYTDETTYNRSQDVAAAQQQKLDNDYRQTQADIDNTYRQKQTDIDNAYRNGQLTQQQRQQAIDNAARERDQNLQQAQFDFDKQQANKPQSAETSSSGTTNYKNNPDIGDEVAWINSNPNTALTEIKANSKALIQKYGVDGYNYLLDQATIKTSSQDSYTKFINP